MSAYIFQSLERAKRADQTLCIRELRVCPPTWGGGAAWLKLGPQREVCVTRLHEITRAEVVRVSLRRRAELIGFHGDAVTDVIAVSGLDVRSPIAVNPRVLIVSDKFELLLDGLRYLARQAS